MVMAGWRDVVIMIHGNYKETVYRSPWIRPDGAMVLKNIEYYNIDDSNEGSCIYFLVNKGGTKNEEIKDFYGCYVDADPDYGIDPADYKVGVMRRVAEMGSLPTLISETKKGYHLFWIFDRSVIAHQGTEYNKRWRNLQMKLAYTFDGDPALASPHQPIRLPMTYHRKDKDDPVFVPVVGPVGRKYSMVELEDSLVNIMVPEGWSEDKRRRMAGRKVSSSDKRVFRGSMEYGEKNYRIQDIKFRRAEALRSALDSQPRSFYNRRDVHDYLTKEVDLCEFLNINSGKIRCPFHDDARPSAGVSTLKTGEQYFKCLSCGMRGNIRSLIRHITGLSKAEAVNFLMYVCGVSLVETDWQRGKRGIFKEMRDNAEDIIKPYPALYKNIKRDLSLYRVLLDESSRHAYDDRQSIGERGIAFFASNRHLAHLLGIQDIKSVQKKIVNLCLHGLVCCLGDDDIPEHLLVESKNLAAKKNYNRISYYTIPPLSLDLLNESEEIAKQVVSSGLRRDALTREGVTRAFDVDMALRIFVHDDEGITEKQDARLLDALSYMNDAIENTGFVYEQSVVEWCAQEWGNTIKVARRKFKRLAPDLGQTYGLRCVRLNKELKKRFALAERGSPSIFIREIPNNRPSG